MNWAAAPASTSTSHRAACTTFLVVTTRSAPKIMNAAMMPKAMFSATIVGTSAFGRGGEDAHDGRGTFLTLASEPAS